MSGVELYVSYPALPDLKFDLDYYLTKHMPLVARTWGPHGMTGWSVVRYPPNDPSGVHVRATVSFTSYAAADEATKNHMTPELYNDLKNYSNHPPQSSKAEVIGRARL